MKQHKLVEAREGHLGASFVKYTFAQNAGPTFHLFKHQVVSDGLLIINLVKIVTVESYSDMEVVVLLLTFLVCTALA